MRRLFALVLALCLIPQVVRADTTGQLVIVVPQASGTDDQTAAEVPITDAGGFFTGGDAEAAFQQIGPTMTDARTPTSHVHAAADTTTGTFATPRLGSGTADATTFLRGDQTWAAPPSSNHTRVLTVDSGGLGDYTTVKAAVDFAASQTPTQTTPWLIQVTPGWYLEDPFTVPIHVHVQGMMTRGPSDTHVVGETFIYTDDTSGDFITLAAGSMSYVSIVSITDATGVMTLVASTANGSYLHASSIYTLSASTVAPVRLLESRSGTLLADTIVLQTMDPASSQTDFIRLTGAAHVSVRNSWLMCNGLSPRSAVYQESTGHAVFYDVRIGTFTGSTFGTDFANINGGTLVVSHDTGYKTATGTLPEDPWGKWYATKRGEREAPSATDTPLTIKGATSQTADLSRWLDSTDTEIAAVDASGAWDGEVLYTPTTPTDWTDPDPVNVTEALDDLAASGGGASSSGTGLQYGDGAGGFSEVTSSSVSGANVTLGGRLALPAGSESATSVNFGAAGTGLFGTASYVGIGTSGNFSWVATGSQFGHAGGASGALYQSTSSATSPGLGPRGGDSDVGLCYGGSDDLRLCAGGVSGLGVTATTTTNYHAILRLTPQASAPATCSIGDLYVDTSGELCACTSANTWTGTTGVGSCA